MLAEASQRCCTEMNSTGVIWKNSESAETPGLRQQKHLCAKIQVGMNEAQQDRTSSKIFV